MGGIIIITVRFQKPVPPEACKKMASLADDTFSDQLVLSGTGPTSHVSDPPLQDNGPIDSTGHLRFDKTGTQMEFEIDPERAAKLQDVDKFVDDFRAGLEANGFPVKKIDVSRPQVCVAE